MDLHVSSIKEFATATFNLYENVALYVRVWCYEGSVYVAHHLAEWLGGFPEQTLGLPQEFSTERAIAERTAMDYVGSLKHPASLNLPVLNFKFPPDERITDKWSILFKPFPIVHEIPRRYFAKDLEKTFIYSYYIENYDDYIFLPDLLSEFIQVYFRVTFDEPLMSAIRRAGYIAGSFILDLVRARISVGWFLMVNYYSFPVSLLFALTDSVEAFVDTTFPTIGGSSYGLSLVMGGVGFLTDSLNYVVPTMPYLASEATFQYKHINGDMVPIMVFHGFPALWRTHPIPNDLRQFWFNECPDVLAYLQSTYPNVDKAIFLPDDLTPAEQTQQLLASCARFIFIILKMGTEGMLNKIIECVNFAVDNPEFITWRFKF